MSPAFHPGELEVQRLAGTRGVAEELSRGLGSELPIRGSSVPALLESVRVLFLTSLTSSKDVWVSPIFGRPGFAKARNAKQLEVALDGLHPHDVLWSNLRDGGEHLGAVALNFERRARWRTNGTVNRGGVPGTTGKLVMDVKESFPNCPKYIARRVVDEETSKLPPLVAEERGVGTEFESRTALADGDKELIRKADTLFFGTYAGDAGADVNHRGGRPGFVRVRSDTEIEFSDYRGNGMFQSFGNLQVSDKAGICFVDYSTGRVLQLTGRAIIDWNVAEARRKDVELSTERVVRFVIHGVRGSNRPVSNYRWQELEESPYNPELRDSTASKQALSRSDRLFPQEVRLVKIVQESSNVKTFRFLASTYIKFEPGQYCTLEFSPDIISDLPPSDGPIVRTWTLSEVANSTEVGDLTLEISVKRKSGGVMSEWLHDQARVGLKASLLGIGGEMTLAAASDAPDLLMISAGVGITPNMAILRGIGAHADGISRDIVFIHQERSAIQAPFQTELFRRAEKSRIKITCLVSGEDGVEGSPWGGSLPDQGAVLTGRRLDRRVLEDIPNLSQRVAFICGPPGFMKSVTSELSDLGGVRQIVTEDFSF